MVLLRNLGNDSGFRDRCIRVRALVIGRLLLVAGFDFGSGLVCFVGARDDISKPREPHMRMQIEIKREPVEAVAATYVPVTYEGGIAATSGPLGWRGLRLAFVTNPDGQRRSLFSSHISSESFQELAQVMMKANPQAAIRAFGSAIKDFGI